jgi:hypothetical protein
MTYDTDCPVEFRSPLQSDLQFDLLANGGRMHRLNEEAVLTNVSPATHMVGAIDLIINFIYEFAPRAFSLMPDMEEDTETLWDFASFWR